MSDAFDGAILMLPSTIFNKVDNSMVRQRISEV